MSRGQQRSPIEAHGVGLDDPDCRAGGFVGEDLAEHGYEPPVHLDRSHRGPGLEQCERQRPEPGPDLDHAVPRADAGKPGDAADRVRVRDKVLPKGPARRKRVFLQQPHDLLP